VVYNNGTNTLTDIFITGGVVYTKGGGVPNPTNNARTLYYGTIIDGNIYLDEHLNFLPV